MRFKRPRSWMQWLRRCSQAICLIAFVLLALSTRFTDTTAPEYLQFFFDIDPLVSLGTILSTRTLAAGSILALITVVVTILLGRVFCGWICPFGAFHNAVSWFRAKRKGRKGAELRSPWQRLKYLILIALLVMAVFGVHWIGVFDPMSFFYRSLTTAVLPGVQSSVEDGATEVYMADPHLGPLHATAVTEPVYTFSRDNIFRVERQVFLGATLIAVLFFVIAGLNLVRQRFWCRYICPLGGLLGLLSKRPALRLHNDESTCKNCGLCNLACPAAAQPDQPGNWLPSECYGCWNCVASCGSNSISFKFESPTKKLSAGPVDLPKRMTMTAGVGGVAALMALRVAPQSEQKPYPETLLRPPGARAEREFLQRCVQCGLCMRVCPTNALQPTALEAGLEGLWTPRLVPKIGYCSYNCNLCGQVCPTGAIEEVPLEEKKKLKIGLATVDRSRCLPWAYGRECIVCEEHCPLSPKAIHLVETEVPLRDGGTAVLKQPHVDPDLCIGCGVCEAKCVFMDKAAIRLTCANESRHDGNQPILPMNTNDYGSFDQGDESSSPY